MPHDDKMIRIIETARDQACRALGALNAAHYILLADPLTFAETDDLNDMVREAKHQLGEAVATLEGD